MIFVVCGSGTKSGNKPVDPSAAEQAAATEQSAKPLVMQSIPAPITMEAEPDPKSKAPAAEDDGDDDAMKKLREMAEKDDFMRDILIQATKEIMLSKK